MKNRINIVVMAVFVLTVLVGCAKKEEKIMPANEVQIQKANTNDMSKEDGKLKIVCTLFPYYDFVRQIAGDKVNNTMLLSPGIDAHSFEPTPANMIQVQQADLFIYNGGEMESWVNQILGAVDNKKQTSLCMMNYVKTVTEEEKEGMEAEEEESTSDEAKEPEYDEHIWTSPVNAKVIVEQICEALKKADPQNASFYQSNTDNYIKQLEELDTQFKQVVDQSKYKIMIVGDKFPLRYFVDQYGLDYRAAFNGCTTETEPSANTIAFLIQKTKEEKVPAVFHMELNSGKIAQTISEATGTKVLTFQSCHNVSKDAFEKGVTYLTLMEENVSALKEGLN